MGTFKGGKVVVHRGARKQIRLTDKSVKAKVAGSYADGAGLYLRVTPNLTKSWVYRFGLNKKTHEMGLGSYPRISLSAARTLAEMHRDSVKRGINPIDARRSQAAPAEVSTFKAFAEEYIETMKSGWRNEKHVSQWRNTMQTYVYPTIGHLPVAEVNKAHILAIVKPIWDNKTETASRIRGRLDRIMSSAIAHDLRQDNPAQWKDNLGSILPAPSVVKKNRNDGEVKHHGAVPYKNVAAFVRAVQATTGIAAIALEFVILTAVRTGEALKAKWSEFDLEAKEWTIPAKRMKGRRLHRVPLSDRAMELLEAMLPLRNKTNYVFPSLVREDQHMSDMALLMLVRRLGFTTLDGKATTTHGFRSTFKDWANEVSNYPHGVSEAALAHSVGDKVVAAYQRGDLFEKRRKMMNDWARYCDTTVRANVLPIRASRRANA